MKKIFIGLIIAFLATAVSSCKKEKPDLVLHDLSAVSGSGTGTVGATITLTVTYPYANGCDLVGKFEESRSGNIFTIKAYAVPVSKESICTQDAGFRNTNYNFTPTATGTFELRFVKTDGSYLNHTIIIQ